MKPIKNLVVLSALAALCGNAVAANWIQIVNIKDPKDPFTVHVNIDSVSIAPSGDIRVAWVKYVHRDNFELSRQIYNCENKSYTLTKLSKYNANGELLSSFEFDAKDPTYTRFVPPQTVAAELLDFVCGLKQPQQQPKKRGDV